MAATGYTSILIYSSSTATNVPLAANLTNSSGGSELAINIADGKLFYKDSGGAVQVLATKAGALGTVTSVGGTGTVNGLTLTGTVTTSGNLTLGGTLDLSSPPAIGGTTPAAGSFTNLSYTGTLTGSTGILNIGSGQIYKDASGNVGIGTSSPGQILTVKGRISISTLTSLANIDGLYSATGIGTILNTGSGNNIAFVNGTTERMRISSAGGLSVGTTADPGAGAIYATGNITAYYSSDARLKENIKDVDNALDIVCAIGSKTFDWTDEYIASKGGEDGYFVQKSDFGVVAQDVQKVFPQAVRTREDGTLAVDYEKLATLSFGAIKSLLARIEQIEAQMPRHIGG